MVQTMSNRRKAGGKQVNEKSFSIVFRPHNFLFPNPPEPPSTCHHVVDKELEKAQEGVCRQSHQHLTAPAPHN
jgi:hypothetical protein